MHGLHIFLTLTICITYCVAYECDEAATECETSLVITHMLTMMHPLHRAVYPQGGKLYKHDVTNTTSASSIDPEEVITADGWEESRLVVVANNSLPGPSLIVYEGQKLKIHVHNDLLSETVTIHWHGLPQHGTPWMDGVAFVTQCPIQPGTKFTYEFYATPKGTYWYHSHVGSQRSKGLFGALVIREKGSSNNSKEHIMTVQGWNHDWGSDMDHQKMTYGIFMNRKLLPGTSSFDGGHFSRFKLTSALINGRGRVYTHNGGHNEAPLSVFNVDPGVTYRFRVIGTGALYPFRISIDDHILTVIASDGYDLQHETADAFIINPGERYDVLIHANKTVGNYWIRAHSLEADADHKVTAILRYTGAADEEPASRARRCTASNRCLVINCPFTYYPASMHTDCKRFDQMRSANDNDPAPSVSGKGDMKEHFLNFAFPGTTLTPGSTNGVKFRFPAVSALTQPTEIDTTCDKEDCGEEKICYCTNSLTVDHDSVVQMVFTNMGKGRGWAHPIHMHGYSFYVLKMGYAEHNDTTGLYIRQNQDVDCRGKGNMDESFCNAATWRNQSWLDGNVPGLELKNPPRKDTLIVPSGGYAVVRIQANNPGVWIMHCHIELHSTDGMVILLNNSYGHSTLQNPPKGYPICGNFPPSKAKHDVAQPTTEAEVERKRKNTEDDPYTMKVFWITVAVLGLVILFMIAYIAVLRDTISKFKEKDKKSVYLPELNGKDNTVFTAN